MRSPVPCPFLLAVLLLAPSLITAGEPSSNPDEATIRKNLDAYVAAYGKKDPAALAALWSENGRFLSPLTGESISGQKNIEAEYRTLFEAAPDAALEVENVSVRFVTPDVALEEGDARIITPDAPPTTASYQAVHVKKDGRWLIDSVRETVAEQAAPADPDTPEGNTVPQLEELAWMIGDWVDSGEGSSISLACSWGMGKCFIRREFAVFVEDIVEMEGIEVIGWDPAEKHFRSWVFDSGGGFGSATWEKSEEGWIKKLGGTTKDGKKIYAEHVIKIIDENSYQWEAHGREADGVPLPNLPQAKVVRLTGAPPSEEPTPQTK